MYIRRPRYIFIYTRGAIVRLLTKTHTHTHEAIMRHIGTGRAEYSDSSTRAQLNSSSAEGYSLYVCWRMLTYAIAHADTTHTHTHTHT